MLKLVFSLQLLPFYCFVHVQSDMYRVQSLFTWVKKVQEQQQDLERRQKVSFSSGCCSEAWRVLLNQPLFTLHCCVGVFIPRLSWRFFAEDLFFAHPYQPLFFSYYCWDSYKAYESPYFGKRVHSSWSIILSKGQCSTVACVVSCPRCISFDSAV